MNIFEKLSEIQNELKAPKNQYNKFGGYYFRNCEDILEAVKPICKKYKTTLLLTDEIEHIGERYYVHATATLFDCEWKTPDDGMANIRAHAFAREEESKKGMDGSQVTGASSSYARKYALNGLFNIDDTKDSDSTNKGESGNPRTQEPSDEPPAQHTESRTRQSDDNHTQNRQDGQGKRMTVEEAMNYSLRSGKYAGKQFRNVPMDYLKWCAENMTGTGKIAAKIVIDYIENN